MKRRIHNLVLALASLVIVAGRAPAQTQNYILRTSDIANVANAYGLSVVRNLGPVDTFLVSGPNSLPPAQLFSQVQADSRVSNFELDGGASHPERAGNPNLGAAGSASALSVATSNLSLVSFYGDSAWTAYVNQPAALTINATAVQQRNITGAGIVAVIDTGVDPNHPLLKRWLVPGYDFTRDQAGIPSELADLDQSTAAILNQSTAALLGQSTVAILNQSTAALLDQSTAALLNTNNLPAAFGHGTMVAGLVHLVAPTAYIMPLKAFTAQGTANISDIVRAIYFAVNNGAKVINMSFSQQGMSQEVLRAVNYANRRGVVCLASVGNQSQSAMVFPAGYGDVIGVASVAADGSLSSFSNFGPDITSVAAPGEALITTYPGSHYAAVSGTSFSVALVAGGEAGIASACKSSDEADALDAFSHNQSYTPQLGYGVINLLSALKYARRSCGQ